MGILVDSQLSNMAINEHGIIGPYLYHIVCDLGWHDGIPTHDNHATIALIATHHVGYEEVNHSS